MFMLIMMHSITYSTPALSKHLRRVGAVVDAPRCADGCCRLPLPHAAFHSHLEVAGSGPPPGDEGVVVREGVSMCGPLSRQDEIDERDALLLNPIYRGAGSMDRLRQRTIGVLETEAWTRGGAPSTVRPPVPAPVPSLDRGGDDGDEFDCVDDV